MTSDIKIIKKKRPCIYAYDYWSKPI